MPLTLVLVRKVYYGYPNLTLEKVRESYSHDGGYTHEYRIEIDSILAKVGAERLWKYIKHKVEELAPFDEKINRDAIE
jgi:hypothetical protein